MAEARKDDVALDLTPEEREAANWIWGKLLEAPDSVQTLPAIRALMYVAFKLRQGYWPIVGSYNLPVGRVLKRLEPCKDRVVLEIESEAMSRSALEKAQEVEWSEPEEEQIPVDPNAPAPWYHELEAETRRKVMEDPQDTGTAHAVGISPELLEEIEQEERLFSTAREPAPTNLEDAWRELREGAGTLGTKRSPDELLDIICLTGLKFGHDRKGWYRIFAAIFDTAWVWDDSVPDETVVNHFMGLA